MLSENFVKQQHKEVAMCMRMCNCAGAYSQKMVFTEAIIINVDWQREMFIISMQNLDIHLDNLDAY